jgi:hypothetical protein
MSLFATQPFYHATIKSFIGVFGEFFSGIKIQKSSTLVKEKLIEVPIEHGPKNKWMERVKEEPDFNNTKVYSTLPRLAYEIVDLSYDPNRKIGARTHYTVGNIAGKRAKVFNPTPYDVAINLYSITKTLDESFQIREQISPYFAPYLTINMEMLPSFNVRKDVPIVLRNTSLEDSYLGTPEQGRTIIQTFSFVAQLDLFGPINPTDNIIKTAYADIGTIIPDSTNNFDLISNNNYRYTAAVTPKSAMPEDNYTINETYFGESTT